MTVTHFVIAVIGDRNVANAALKLFIILSHFNSAIDPIIYAYRIKDVRTVIKRLLRCGRETSSGGLDRSIQLKDFDSTLTSRVLSRESKRNFLVST